MHKHLGFKEGLVGGSEFSRPAAQPCHLYFECSQVIVMRSQA